MTPDDFIAKWRGTKGGAERANYGQFINDFCHALALRVPEVAEGGTLGPYQFDGPVSGGSFRSLKSTGFIDLYKKGCFILEAKQSYLAPDEAEPARPEGGSYDRLMKTAYAQAKHYSANLPADHPGVPFLIVCDIGRAFEIYFDWAGNGRGFEPFPNAQSHRITLDQLADPEIQKRLRGIWENPDAIDPRKIAADVTGRVAVDLALVSRGLEETLRLKRDGMAPSAIAEQSQDAALFLMRILFCLFAEDVALLPPGSFTAFLERTREKDEVFRRQLESLWLNMGQAHKADRFADAVEAQVPYFNGGLFRDARVFPLITSDREALLRAAKSDWKNVEPAIFGTMLEKALEGADRDKLGAHYTPRTYVE